jgi:SAM-dependent methyltransferase
MKRHAPAADRNRTPILEVLRPLLHDGALVLEIASGSGQHVVHFATSLPRVTFQPTDADRGALASIEAHRADAALTNVLPPLRLDASSASWPVTRADAVVCINMIHISPFACTEGLFAGAHRVLPPGGLLYLYGPYRFSGAFTAPSNEAFDASLRAQNPAWGVRDVDDLVRLASGAGLEHEATVPMPANNHSLLFRKRA